MKQEVQALLLEIARCENVARSRSPDTAHPCSRIVATQPGELATMHVPEPWCGRIESAPILFVSSNPGIADEEEFPTRAWADDDIVDYFAQRFSGGRKPWIVDGRRRLNRDGSYSKALPYWSNMRERAREILARDPVPGDDYAITEIVHCKSRREAGVSEALDECTRRYLRRVLHVSAARVLVAIGDKAWNHLTRLLRIPGDGPLIGPIEVEGINRVLVALGHPAGGKPKKLFHVLVRCAAAAGKGLAGWGGAVRMRTVNHPELLAVGVGANAGVQVRRSLMIRTP